MIYSPFHPTKYTRSGLGHGAWYKDDLAMWNLVWLSIPKIDRYLDDSLSISEILPEIDSTYVGSVTASLDTDAVDIFPDLRRFLSLRPELFLEKFLRGPYTELRAFELYGMTWIDIICKRVQESVRICQEVSPGSVEEGSGGTVVHVSFARGVRENRPQQFDTCEDEHSLSFQTQEIGRWIASKSRDTTILWNRFATACHAVGIKEAHEAFKEVFLRNGIKDATRTGVGKTLSSYASLMRRAARNGIKANGEDGELKSVAVLEKENIACELRRLTNNPHAAEDLSIVARAIDILSQSPQLFATEIEQIASLRSQLIKLTESD